MSLDVSLHNNVCEKCNRADVCYDRNITHNLNVMAKHAGLYEALWNPLENKWEKASDIIPMLERGLKKLKKNPQKYKKFNPSNGWGTYEGFVDFTEGYLNACKNFPNAKIGISK